MSLRVALAGLVLVLPLLAGCAGPSATSTSAGPRGVSKLPDVPSTTVFQLASGKPIDLAHLAANNTPLRAVGGYNGIGTTTFEPSIGITKSGALFMSSLKRAINPTGGQVDEGTHVIRGTDQGRTWKDMGPFLGPTSTTQTVNSNDPFIYVDPWTSRVIDFDMCGTLSAFCESYSDDEGATWHVQSIVTGEETALDHQSIAAAPAGEGATTVGYPNVLVFCVNRGSGTAGSFCSSSRDGGVSWTPLAPGYPVGTQQCSGLSAHVHGAPDGRFYRGNPSCSGPAVYRSDDGGLTWSEHTIPAPKGVSGHDVETAVDSADHVHAFWIGADGLPYEASSKDRGDTWTAPRMVAPLGVNETGFPAIAAGSDGRIAFAYIGAHVEGGYKAKQDGANWTGYLGVMTDAFADDPLITTVAVNAPGDYLSHGACGNVRCGGFGDFIGVEIDPQGRPWATMANNNHKQAGIVGTLLEGPSLRGDSLVALPPIQLGGPKSLPS